MRFSRLLLVIAVAAAVVSLSCGGGDGADVDGTEPTEVGVDSTEPTDAVGGEATRLVVIDQNILHGIIDEDPEAEPYDRFSERLPLIAEALAKARPDVVFLQEGVNA